jgi:hypothetical protein
LASALSGLLAMSVPASADGFNPGRRYPAKYVRWHPCQCGGLAGVYVTPAQDYSAFFYRTYRIRATYLGRIH